MTIYTITSSAIKEMVYDESKQYLYVLFNGDNTYQYFNVPLDVIERVVNSSSVGKAFSTIIKKHEELYPYETIGADDYQEAFNLAANVRYEIPVIIEGYSMAAICTCETY